MRTRRRRSYKYGQERNYSYRPGRLELTQWCLMGIGIVSTELSFSFAACFGVQYVWNPGPHT